MQQAVIEEGMATLVGGGGMGGDVVAAAAIGGGGSDGLGGAGGGAFETPTARTYDDLFPALPESTQRNNREMNQMRVGSSTITLVFRVPVEERRNDNERFGEGESIMTCTKIMQETGARIEISSSRDQSLSFLVTGKHSEVLEARRKITASFQTQASRQISIPKEHHRWILGKSGERLKNLERMTATRISVPSMHDQSDLVTITGAKDGVEKAEHEIRITSDEQSKKAFERVAVPKIYHPFIVGPFNKWLQAMIEETGARVNVPPSSVMNDEITIAGEKDGVAAAKAKILAIHKEMEKKCTTVSVEVPRQQHRYVIGPKGSTIAEILEETGVYVDVPPSDSNTGTITLRGPHDKLGLALTKVYDKSNSVKTSTINAPDWVHRYIIGKKGVNIKEITANFPKVHVEFENQQIKIEGPPEQNEAAYEKLDGIVKDLLARIVFREIQVDPKHYKHIIGKSGANVNRLKDELNVSINVDDCGLIKIEGEKKGVEQAKLELETMVHKLENEKERDAIIEQRYYKSIIGTKGDNIREIRDKFNQVQITFPGPSADKRDIVKIRGPKDDVDRCYKHLMKVVRELSESSFQKEVPIFKEFHKFIIGKGGANIRKIREETQTHIDLPAEGDKNEVITITGKKENVDEACEKIRKIQNELETIVTVEITIDPKFYNSLIGSRGKLVHSITEECGGVAIKFPSTESRSDKVTIRGPKDDVERAKQQLLDLASEKLLSSFTAEVRAKSQHHKFIIGKNGSKIRKIRDATGARIVFPVDSDEDKELITIIGKKEAVEQAKATLEALIKEIDNITECEMNVEARHHKHFVARRGEVLHRIADECGGVQISFPRPGVLSERVVLKGSKECIEAAKQRIQEIIVDLESMITIDCVIPQTLHRTIMGSKGHKVQGITSEFDVQIKFPDKNASEEPEMNGDVDVEGEDKVRKCDIIRIMGKAEQCAKAKQALLDLRPVTIDLEVPYQLHGLIIGQRGRDIKEIRENYDVNIVLSPVEQQDSIIKITGAKANVEQAKEAILDRVKEIESDKRDRELKSYVLEVEVKPEYHSMIIGRRGAVVTRIRTDHDVFIGFPNKGDPNQNKITITGYEEATANARDDILKIVSDLESQARCEVSIDPRLHSRIIGSRGRNIHKIMEDFKVHLAFPRADDEDKSLVVITGSNEDNAFEAKDYLLNIQEEFMQDLADQELMDQYRRRPNDGRDPMGGGGPGGPGGAGDGNNGFIVEGGPWEQQPHNQRGGGGGGGGGHGSNGGGGGGGSVAPAPREAPNTSSVTEFPSVGGRSRGRNAHLQQQQQQHPGGGLTAGEENGTATPAAPPPLVANAWGPRR